MKPWHELGITDDFIFCKVMQNESICRQMLEILLNIKIDRLDYVQNQYSISPDYNSHSIRLDVYVKDKDKVYDIEIRGVSLRLGLVAGRSLVRMSLLRL